MENQRKQMVKQNERDENESNPSKLVKLFPFLHFESHKSHLLYVEKSFSKFLGEQAAKEQLRYPLTKKSSSVETINKSWKVMENQRKQMVKQNERDENESNPSKPVKLFPFLHFESHKSHLLYVEKSFSKFLGEQAAKEQLRYRCVDEEK
ncbi:hypothetical protein CDAR_580901 [Caerostris darwini]|uniref:Uncharacterized protein n=1 Tax=Caerostris darwini TaxID=1538125 RepID=A0AAV4WLA7_9ARAC|nr:hypothetical protein CDAR_580901 [Caerostris darwini]